MDTFDKFGQLRVDFTDEELNSIPEARRALFYDLADKNLNDRDATAIKTATNVKLIEAVRELNTAEVAHFKVAPPVDRIDALREHIWRQQNPDAPPKKVERVPTLDALEAAVVVAEAARKADREAAVVQKRCRAELASAITAWQLSHEPIDGAGEHLKRTHQHVIEAHVPAAPKEWPIETAMRAGKSPGSARPKQLHFKP